MPIERNQRGISKAIPVAQQPIIKPQRTVIVYFQCVTERRDNLHSLKRLFLGLIHRIHSSIRRIHSNLRRVVRRYSPKLIGHPYRF